MHADARRRVPSIAIRVVGDTSDEDLPLDFSRAIGPEGAIDAAALAVDAVRRPWRWPSLVRFGIGQRRALARLADVLDRFTRALAR